MILDKQTALKLESLMHKEVEEALILLFDNLLKQELHILSDLDASEASLKAFQGKYTLLQELKEYKQRITDAIGNGRTTFSS